MAVLLQIDFPFSGPWGEDMAAGMEALATSIAAEPGLQWKIWTENREAGEAGGIYLFADRASAEAYLAMHRARLLGFGIAAAAFAAFAAALGQAQGDRMTIGSDGGMVTIAQSGWTLFDEDAAVHPAVVDIWHGLAEGMLVAHNRRLALEWRSRGCRAPFRFEWRLRPVEAAPF